MRTSVRLSRSLGTALAVEETGDAYVAGFISSSPGDESGDQIVVHKVRQREGCARENETILLNHEIE